MSFDGERTATFCWLDGTPIEGGTIKFATVLYRGVYVAGKAYEQGDQVTFAGSSWIARADTAEKPGDGATAWQLAVKAGRTGPAGTPGGQGAPGPKGEKGDPGRNFT